MNLYLKKRKSFLKKILIGLSLFALGALAFFLVSALANRYFPSPWVSHPLVLILVATLICLVAYKPLDKAVSLFFRHFLFRNKSYAHLALTHLAEELLLVLDLKELGNLIVNTFAEVLQLKTVALAVPDAARDDFELVSAYGWPISETRRLRIPSQSALVRLMGSRGSHILVRDPVIRMHAWQEANTLAHEFDRLRASWIIPLFAGEDLAGFIAFAPPRPENILDEADFQFFREFARPVAKSVRNALAVQELKKANLKLQDVQSELLQSIKLQAVEQLATGLAHEIHNPLTIISGKAQVLLLQKDRHAVDERVEQVLQTIVKQTKRAADITRKLLMFSQGSGAARQEIHLEQVLEDTLALVSYQTSLEGIEITRDIPAPLPPLEANLHEMREVFLNLVLNAVQSIESHGRIHVQMRDRPEDQVIEISLSDTGKGITADHLQKLFNPFFTTRADATGLGLFLTRQIIHRYGGSIRAESRPPEGSLFCVELPYGRPSGKEPVPARMTAEVRQP